MVIHYTLHILETQLARTVTLLRVGDLSVTRGDTAVIKMLLISRKQPAI